MSRSTLARLTPIVLRLALLAALVPVAAAGCRSSGPPPEAYLADAEQALEQERWTEAQAMVELALDVNDGYRRALELLAQVHRSRGAAAYEAGNLEAAYVQMQKAADAEPARLKRAGDLMAAVDLGTQLGRPADELAPLAERAIEADPTSLEHRLTVAYLWEDSASPERAIEHYLWIWAADPERVPIALRLGMLYLEAGRFVDAVAIMGQVLAREPDNVQAALNRAEAYEHLRNPAEARAHFTSLLERYPDNANILFRYAAFLERQGDVHGAHAARERAQDTMPGVERRELRKLR